MVVSYDDAFERRLCELWEIHPSEPSISMACSRCAWRKAGLTSQTIHDAPIVDESLRKAGGVRIEASEE
jgi:hypothetical protein